MGNNWVEIWSWNRKRSLWVHLHPATESLLAELRVATYTESKFKLSFKQIYKKIDDGCFFCPQSQIFQKFWWFFIKINEKQRKTIGFLCFHSFWPKIMKTLDFFSKNWVPTTHQNTLKSKKTPEMNELEADNHSLKIWAHNSSKQKSLSILNF